MLEPLPYAKKTGPEVFTMGIKTPASIVTLNNIEKPVHAMLW